MSVFSTSLIGLVVPDEAVGESGGDCGGDCGGTACQSLPSNIFKVSQN